MDYFLYLYIADMYLQFWKKEFLNLGNKFHYKKYKERDGNTRNKFAFVFRHSIYMYITLKGTEKILFVSVLTILLICKSLNFTVTFTKKLKLSKFAFNFPCEKINFSLVHRNLITIHNFWRTLLSSWVLPVVTKSYIQTDSKSSDYWIFLISKNSPIHMHLYSYGSTCPEF